MGERYLESWSTMKDGGWRISEGFQRSLIAEGTTFSCITPLLDPNEEMKVCELLDSTSMEWKEEKLNQVLWDVDVNCILSIPIEETRRADKSIWHYDTKGRYTVKSNYRVAFQRIHAVGSTMGDGLGVFWNALWGADIPNKVKVFVWKCFHECIPVFLNLQRCRVGAVTLV